MFLAEYRSKVTRRAYPKVRKKKYEGKKYGTKDTGKKVRKKKNGEKSTGKKVTEKRST
jgi:hypothetical protein